MRFGLPEQTIAIVRNILMRHPHVEKAIVYGSRVTGTYHAGSDIDLTLVGNRLSYEDLTQIMREFYESPIPYTVDLSLLHLIEDAAVRDHIERRGQVIYQRDGSSSVPM